MSAYQLEFKEQWVKSKVSDKQRNQVDFNVLERVHHTGKLVLVMKNCMF